MHKLIWPDKEPPGPGLSLLGSEALPSFRVAGKPCRHVLFSLRRCDCLLASAAACFSAGRLVKPFAPSTSEAQQPEQTAEQPQEAADPPQLGFFEDTLSFFAAQVRLFLVILLWDSIGSLRVRDTATFFWRLG